MRKDLSGKRIAFLATDGVEQSELRRPWEAIKDAGAEVELLSIHAGDLSRPVDARRGGRRAG